MSLNLLYENDVGENNILTFRQYASGFTPINNFNPAVNDPLFIDRATHDYRLRLSSPAIGGAIRMGAPFDDEVPLSKNPDYGAYDTGLPYWMPGALIRSIDLDGLAYDCVSDVSASFYCTVSGLPIGRKLPLTFNLNVQSSNGISGTSAGCRTQYDYNIHLGVGLCSGVIPPSGSPSGPPSSSMLRWTIPLGSARGRQLPSNHYRSFRLSLGVQQEGRRYLYLGRHFRLVQQSIALRLRFSSRVQEPICMTIPSL